MKGTLQPKTFLLWGILLLLGSIHLFNGNRTTKNIRFLGGIQQSSSANSTSPSIYSSSWHHGLINAKSSSSPRYKNQISPACRPHFQVVSPPDQPLHWSFSSKFQRLYFYHARKAGGTSMAYYFEKVAKHHGLEFASMEYRGSEWPGTHDKTTFYVTHLRHPIDRSLSHFKYEGRWDCKQLIHNFTSYNASEANANKLETWNGTAGHHGTPSSCVKKSTGLAFRLVTCAVNCYTQWYSSLSCPAWDIPIETQTKKAKEVLLRFNLIVVLEKLRDPAYVAAVENFTGVPGLTYARSAWCERESHEANTNHPLVVKNETLHHLTELNQVDMELYNNITNCLSDGLYDFPTWDEDRFVKNETSHVPYQDFHEWKMEQRNNKAKDMEKKKETEMKTTS